MPPVDSSYSPSTEIAQRFQLCEKQGKVSYAHVFIATVERTQLGLVEGGWEECPISQEPIADARLPSSDKVRVSHSNPELTGVELLCGHRFSAVFLLWHWVRSLIICPMCRAQYSLKIGMVSGRPSTGNVPVKDDTSVCNVNIFPPNHWRKLLFVHIRRKKNAKSLIASYHTESVLDDTLEMVVRSSQHFFLRLSLSNGEGQERHHHGNNGRHVSILGSESITSEIHYSCQ